MCKLALSCIHTHQLVWNFTFITCRNSVAGLRPSFRELLLTLLSNPKTVLSIPQEALNTHNLAGVLGSPLEAGANMYRDLQNKYCDNADYQELA